jgi:hypothetical protein
VNVNNMRPAPYLSTIVAQSDPGQLDAAMLFGWDASSFEDARRRHETHPHRLRIQPGSVMVEKLAPEECGAGSRNTQRLSALAEDA